MSVYKGGSKPFTTEEYVEKAKLIHGDDYDYSLVEYKNAKTKIMIKCKKCGNIFSQNPDSHLRGNGCPKCGKINSHNKQRKIQENFLSDMKKIHKTLDFSEAKYINAKTPVEVKCLICGCDFKKTPNELSRNGCPVCSNNKRQEHLRKIRYQESIKKINLILEKSDAELLDEYNGTYEIRGHKFRRYNFKCKKCGYTFVDYFDNQHLPLCPICNEGKNSSKGELEIRRYILKNFPQLKIFPNNRTILEGKEIDILIPELKIGFEYDGTYWHKDKEEYDKAKDELAKTKGIIIYHIAEKRNKKEKEENFIKVKEIINKELKARKKR